MFGIFIGMIYAGVLTGSAIRESIDNFNDRFEARKNCRLTYIDFRGIERRVDNNHMVTERTMNGDNCLIDMKTEEILINYTRIKKANEEYEKKKWEEKVKEKKNKEEEKYLARRKKEIKEYGIDNTYLNTCKWIRVKDNIGIAKHNSPYGLEGYCLVPNISYNKYDQYFTLSYCVRVSNWGHFDYISDYEKKSLYQKYVNYMKHNDDYVFKNHKYKYEDYYRSIIPPIYSYEEFLDLWENNKGWIIKEVK